jgi:hypothetical protein
LVGHLCLLLRGFDLGILRLDGEAPDLSVEVFWIRAVTSSARMYLQQSERRTIFMMRVLIVNADLFLFFAFVGMLMCTSFTWGRTSYHAAWIFGNLLWGY